MPHILTSNMRTNTKDKTTQEIQAAVTAILDQVVEVQGSLNAHSMNVLHKAIDKSEWYGLLECANTLGEVCNALSVVKERLEGSANG